ncbi:hypothetical protein EHP00_1875 [Ecytonucleospora hepatopenaei]|uniref:Uncharacterized protein n=1 Tax=Ecytonucleospora hepatopenaei TaxID=646526 RepID=A0A1W0E4A2_9MICR|nr:hypothetical protein EHP00_1875 [Ecytonucleospora hepatopenaei]
MNVNIGYECLKTLGKILKDEKSFQIQIFTLETLDILEGFLQYKKIKYKKVFVSKYNIEDEELCILLKDNKNFEIGNHSKVILWSNERDRRFVPYKLVLTESEKERLVLKQLQSKKQDEETENKKEIDLKKKFIQNKKLSYCSISRTKIDAATYIANALDYLECVIVFCLVRESKLEKLCYEVKEVNEELTNKTTIKMALNNLVRHKIVTKKGNVYKINVHTQTVQKICEKIGFGKVFQ